MLRAMLVARTRGHKQWADLFLFVFCYATSILINAIFDVTLEGPMQGIWFWCLFGFGIGSAMIYRAQATDELGSSRSMTAWNPGASGAQGAERRCGCLQPPARCRGQQTPVSRARPVLAMRSPSSPVR